MSPRRIAIVGNGASGTILAAELLQRASQPLEVLLIGRDELPGRGVAYGTTSDDHLLNVPAGRMSAIADDPGHFLRWLESRAYAPVSEETYAPRRLYGQYIGDLLDEAERGARSGSSLVPIRADATSLSVERGTIRLVLADGRRIDADRVVLALGHLPHRWPIPVPFAHVAERLVDDPWAPGALDSLPHEGDVLVLGTGLTMIDVVLGLASRGHRGTIHAVSRHGLLPRPHPARRQSWSYDVDGGLGGAIGLRQLLRRLRREAARAEGAGGCWADALDTIRPVVTEVWLRLSMDDRRCFLRHLRPWWDVHRHRMAPEVAERFTSLRDSGFVRIQAGRVGRVVEGPEGLSISVRRRGETTADTLDVSVLVNATGPSSDFLRDAPPIVRSLVASGLARFDPLGLGLDATPDGVLLDAGGSPRPSLALGLPLRGVLWETTSIPDIRIQAHRLAGRSSSLTPVL